MDASLPTTDQLVARYAAAARRHGEATLDGNDRGNDDADEIATIYRELRQRRSQSALLPLLRTDDRRVRAWAAAHALEFAPGEGEPVLLQLAESRDIIGFDAETTLSEWRAGRLRFP